MRALVVLLALLVVGCSRYDYQQRRVEDQTQIVRIHKWTGRAEILTRSYSGGEYWRPVQTQTERFASPRPTAPESAGWFSSARARRASSAGVAALRRMNALRGERRGGPRLGPVTPAEFSGSNGVTLRALHDESVRHFREAARLDPSTPKHHYYLGVSLEYGGRTQEAVIAYQEAFRLDPGHSNASAAVARLATVR